MHLRGLAVRSGRRRLGSVRFSTLRSFLSSFLISLYSRCFVILPSIRGFFFWMFCSFVELVVFVR
ncbi:hypothetical protein C8R45DRAFT_1005865 [Mycena sanguinolenta]|nr:hypothetical protein C8R45DRAFT_1005865 [Mycena sanguinolenta]